MEKFSSSRKNIKIFQS